VGPSDRRSWSHRARLAVRGGGQLARTSAWMSALLPLEAPSGGRWGGSAGHARHLAAGMGGPLADRRNPRRTLSMTLGPRRMQRSSICVPHFGQAHASMPKTTFRSRAQGNHRGDVDGCAPNVLQLSSCTGGVGTTSARRPDRDASRVDRGNLPPSPSQNRT
jgi:hypothetical protein